MVDRGASLATGLAGDPVTGSAAATAGDATRFTPPHASPLDTERRLVEMDLLGRLADLIASGRSLIEIAGAAVDLMHGRAGHDLAVVLEQRDGRLAPVAARGEGADRLSWTSDLAGLPGRALTAPGPVGETGTSGHDWLPLGHRLPTRLAVAIPGDSGRPWGVLVTADDTPLASLGELETFLVAVARQLGVAVHTERLRAETSTQLHRAEALRRIATDIGSKLDLEQILAGVVDHARVLFGGDRAAVFLGRPDGRVTAEVARGLSPAYLEAVRDFPAPSLPAEAAAARRPLFATHYRDDPRAADVRSAVVQEGFDTICAAPLCDGADLLGLLIVFHDRPHAWTEEELATLAGFAAQAATAIKNAQNYERMATWAAHLQSIQQLGARLARLTTEVEIGTAIANELDQLIEYHNVRVYRLRADGWVVPVAMRGLVGEFHDETPDQLRIRVGQGITGWVAEHNVAQNIADAAHDPRAMTIPGTEEDLDESMLLAPLVFEERVLGVIVLSKLGLRQFSDDDLRLLVIYAAFAAQAIAQRRCHRAAAPAVDPAGAAPRRSAGPPRDHAARSSGPSTCRGSSTRWRTAWRRSCAGTTSPSSGWTRPRGCSRPSWPAASTPTSTSSRGSPAKRAWRPGSSPTASLSWSSTSCGTPGSASSPRPGTWRAA